MPQLSSFNTNVFPERSRFQNWEQRVRMSLGDVSMRRSLDVEFDAWSNTISDNGVRVGRIGISACPVELSAQRKSATREDMVHVIFPISGSIDLQQFGRRAVLEPGDWGMLMVGESFRHTHETAVEILLLAAPRQILFPEFTAERFTAQRFRADSGSASLAKNYLEMLLSERAALNPLTAPELIATAARLVRIAALEHSIGSTKRNRQQLLQLRIRDFVDRNLQNAELTIETVAEALNCSKRYIHRAFSASGETISQYILRSRLEHCHHCLKQPAMEHLSVTEIAFWWGFNNPAHFSRVFRRQFGMPPSEARKSEPARS